MTRFRFARLLWQLSLLFVGVGLGLTLHALPAHAQTEPVTPLTTTNEITITASAALTVTDFPELLANVRLGGPDDRLLDLRVDAPANRLYVSDSVGQLHILDATTYRTLAVLPASGALTLNAARNRLYVAPADRYYQPEPAITVIDTVALTIVTTIPDATHLAVDFANNRLFVGQTVTAPDPAARPPVRMIDGEDWAALAELPISGVPFYNPLRDEVLIQASSLFIVDPTSNQIVQDLLPALSEQECIDCVGAQYVADVALFPAENLLAVAVQTRATAGGPGLIESPRWFDATTLEPWPDAAPTPLLQPHCGSEPMLQSNAGQRRYPVDRYERYYAYTNWRIETANGEPLTWLDGLPAPFINAAIGQAYAGDLVYDLDPLRPIGALPTGFCLLAYDRERGQFYGGTAGDGAGGTLLVFAERGAEAPSLANQSVPGLPARPIRQILVSPNYQNDETIFLTSGSALYRSADGGERWQELRAGLWIDPALALTAALSPDFGQDRTILVAAAGQSRGGGIFRSSDRGETWQPVWQGLTHLAVDSLSFSPNFATDGTILAGAHYQRIQPWETGRSFFRSTDGGTRWGLVLTATATISPAAQIGLWPSVPLTETATANGWRLRAADQLEFTTDGGATWQQFTPDLPGDERAVATVIAPSADVAYLLTNTNLWRWSAAGSSGERWLDERVAARTFTNTLSALAVSPPLVDGSIRLILGSAAGEVWTLDPASVRWGTDDASLTPTSATQTSISATEAITTTGIVATPTPSAPPTGDPPTGSYRPEGTFAGVWSANEAVQGALGWAQSQQSSGVAAATQTFEQGTMIWRGDTSEIVVLYSDGTWASYADSFREGEAEFDPSLTAPGDIRQPVRGFGKVWREEVAVRERLGWATAREQGITAQTQGFERGTMLWVNGLIYVLIEDPDGTQRWLVA